MEVGYDESNLFDEAHMTTDEFGERQTARWSEAESSGFSRIVN